MKRAALLLLLAACARRDPVPDAPDAAPTAEAEQIAEGLRDFPDDAAAMAALGARRDGATLTVPLGGRTLRFTDRDYCEGFDTCQRWRLDALHAGRFAGVRYEHGESPGDYLLYDRRSRAAPVNTEARPSVSPSGALALVAAGETVNEPAFPGVAVLALPSGRVLFRDDAPANVADRLIGWRGEDCAAFATAAGPIRHVARAGGAWRVADGPCP